MKKYTLALLLLSSVTLLHAQTYETTTETDGTKILKGFISREALQNDTAFNWYAPNAKAYSPEAGAQAGLKVHADSLQLVAFMGTWCGDSHFIIPKFFTLLDAAGFPGNHVTVIGVDRAKKTPGHLAEALQVINVPTLIVFKNGKELGRVVEYGKTGAWDKELGEIISKSF